MKTIDIVKRGLLWEPRFNERAMAQQNVVLESSFPFVTEWSACVTAGANVGYYETILSQKFGTVYAAEPDATNFTCLSRNVERHNVIRLECAFGFERGPVGLHMHKSRCGRHYVSGDGNIPVLRVDDLGLSKCGLVVVDTEGSEFEVLKGAAETLSRCKPVVLMEFAHLERFGSSLDEVTAWLFDHGYEIAQSLPRDIIACAR